MKSFMPYYAFIIMFYNVYLACYQGSTEGAGGGTAGGGVTTRGRPGAKDVGLRFPMCCGVDP